MRLVVHVECGAGSDRAFRRYWVGRGVAGLFAEAGAEAEAGAGADADARGGCSKPVAQLPRAAHGDTLAHVTKLFEAQRERGN